MRGLSQIEEYMAKGDAGDAQTMINNQGALAQNYINNLSGMYQSAPGSAVERGTVFNPQNRSGNTGINGGRTPSNVNLDPAYLKEQITQSWARTHNGEAIPPDQLNYWMEKASNPEEYSDGNTRVGWNPYWEARMKPGNEASADPSLAGTEGIIGKNGSSGTAGGMQLPQDLSGALSGYSEFAKTGGFSPEDIANFRSRGLAPTKAAYQLGQAEMERHKALSGYSPNYNAAAVKMAREQGQALNDASVNTEASLAQMKQQGRLAGLGGLSNIGLTSRNQMIDVGRLQNQLGLGLIGSQIQKSQIPGNYDVAMGRVGNTAKIAGGILGGVFGK